MRGYLEIEFDKPVENWLCVSVGGYHVMDKCGNEYGFDFDSTEVSIDGCVIAFWLREFTTEYYDNPSTIPWGDLVAFTDLYIECDGNSEIVCVNEFSLSDDDGFVYSFSREMLDEAIETNIAG